MNPEQNCNLLIGQHPLVRRGQFEVHHYEGPAAEGQKIAETKGNKLFVDNGSLGDDFVATGIVYRELNKGEKVLLLRHPDDRFSRIEP
jgi:hypothetical protein